MSEGDFSYPTSNIVFLQFDIIKGGRRIIKFVEAETDEDKIFCLGAVLWLSSLLDNACLQVDIKDISYVKDKDFLIGHLCQLPLCIFGIIGVAAPLLRLLEYLKMG